MLITPSALRKCWKRGSDENYDQFVRKTQRINTKRWPGRSRKTWSICRDPNQHFIHKHKNIEVTEMVIHQTLRKTIRTTVLHDSKFKIEQMLRTSQCSRNRILRIYYMLLTQAKVFLLYLPVAPHTGALLKLGPFWHGTHLKQFTYSTSWGQSMVSNTS